MPIYEFYCTDCHTVFSFFTSSPHNQRQPACPRCQRPDLERKPSSFATLKHRDEGAEGDGFEGLDESKLEGAMGTLMGEMESVDENDPKAMSRMMRRFGELSGLEMGGRMEEMMQRLEAGEDPESLEHEMETDPGGEDESFDDFFRLKKVVQTRRKPRVDEELYFL